MTTSLPDGLDLVEPILPAVMDLIAQTARWVHPEVFRALPVWRPDTARKRPIYTADWRRLTKKTETNVAAQKALRAALGLRTTPNWTTCHVWGYDDPTFAADGQIVRDPRFYSCVGNVILLPTPLKGFTDSVPWIKLCLRTCAFHLYGWVPPHAGEDCEAARIRAGQVPDNYPSCWPTSNRVILPPGTGPASPDILWQAAEQKHKIARQLADASLTHYPRDEVRAVLAFWNIDLEEASAPREPRVDPTTHLIRHLLGQGG